MVNNQSYKEERYDSYLNKIIIFSSKGYFKKQANLVNKERTIVDDEDYASFLQDFLMIDRVFSTVDDVVNSVELNNALKSLSAIEQSVIFLLFKKELSQEEAAKMLEICSRTVRRIKLRAIKKLREYLKGDINDER